LKLSTDPEFTIGKELIVQGLACKLGGAHQFGTDDLKINIKPRAAMGIAADEFPLTPEH